MKAHPLGLPALVLLASACNSPPPANAPTGGATSTAATATPPPPTGSAGETPAPTGTGSATPATPLTPEQIAARFEQCTGYVNAKDKAHLAECYAENATAGLPGFPPAQGPQQIVEAVYGDGWTAFPDFHQEDQVVLVNGNHVAALVLATGTNTGPFKGMNMPATGKKIGVYGLRLVDFDQSGKIVKELHATDPSQIMGQLGAPIPHREAVAPSAGGGQPKIVIATGSQAEKDNVALAKNLDALFFAKDLDDMLASYADDAVMHDVSMPKDLGKKDAKAAIAPLFSAFPDMHGAPSEAWGAGDYVVVVDPWQATNSGDAPAMHLKKTGKPVQLTDYELYVFKDGKVSQFWAFRNGLSMAMQLGLVPQGGPPTAPTTAPPAH